MLYRELDLPLSEIGVMLDQTEDKTAGFCRSIKSSCKTKSSIKRHLQWVSRFYTPTAEIYSGLGDLYVEHDDFRQMYEGYRPGLAQYLRDGMKALAERELS
jgi:hypothetical protein